MLPLPILLVACMRSTAYDAARSCAAAFLESNPGEPDAWMVGDRFGGVWNDDYVGEVFGTSKIANVTMMDGPAGVRDVLVGQAYANRTAWPAPGNHGLVWSRALSYAVGKSGARDFAAVKAGVQLGPGVNVHRLPIGGRNWEYVSGEDALLGVFAGELAKGIQSESVMGCAKHFALNSQELNRTGTVAVVDEATLMATYLRAYQSQIDAGVGAFMCSYNRVQVAEHSETVAYMCGSEHVTKKLLRDTMGFGGVVMTDWTNHITSTTNNVTTQVRDVFEWEMNTVGIPLQFAVPKNATVRHQLAANALSGMYISGLLPSPSTCSPPPKFNPPPPPTDGLPPSYKAAVSSLDPKSLASILVAEGMVMLKNVGGALPLAGPLNIILTGEAMLSGGGSGDNGAFGYENAGHVGQDLHTGGAYAQNYMKEALAEGFGEGTNVAWDYDAAGLTADVVLVFGAQFRSEAYLVGNADGRYNIDRCDSALARQNSVGDTYGNCTYTAFVLEWRKRQPNAKIVSVTTVGGVHYAADYLPNVDAALTTYYPGQYFADALVSVLSGQTSPGGRLSYTLPNVEWGPNAATYIQSPVARFNPGLIYVDSAQAFTLKAPGYFWNETEQVFTDIVQYGADSSAFMEKALVGYKYYEKYNMPPLFPFGFGLSFYESVSVSFTGQPACNSSQAGGCDVAFDVQLAKKSGAGFPEIGSEVILVYVGYKSDQPSLDADRPVRELGGFLKVWQSGSFTVQLPESAFRSAWDTKTRSWTTPCGFDGVDGTFNIYLNNTIVR
eukprot:gene13180-20354_t